MVILLSTGGHVPPLTLTTNGPRPDRHLPRKLTADDADLSLRRSPADRHSADLPYLPAALQPPEPLTAAPPAEIRAWTRHSATFRSGLTRAWSRSGRAGSSGEDRRRCGTGSVLCRSQCRRAACRSGRAALRARRLRGTLVRDGRVMKTRPLHGLAVTELGFGAPLSAIFTGGQNIGPLTSPPAITRPVKQGRPGRHLRSDGRAVQAAGHRCLRDCPFLVGGAAAGSRSGAGFRWWCCRWGRRGTCRRPG